MVARRAECKDWWGGFLSLTIGQAREKMAPWRKSSADASPPAKLPTPPLLICKTPKKQTHDQTQVGLVCVFSPGNAFLWVTAVNNWLKVGATKRKPTRRDGRREASSETVAPQWRWGWGGLKMEHPPALWDLAAPSCWQERTNRAEQRGR